MGEGVLLEDRSQFLRGAGDGIGPHEAVEIEQAVPLQLVAAPRYQRVARLVVEPSSDSGSRLRILAMLSTCWMRLWDRTKTCRVSTLHRHPCQWRRGPIPASARQPGAAVLSARTGYGRTGGWAGLRARDGIRGAASGAPVQPGPHGRTRAHRPRTPGQAPDAPAGGACRRGARAEGAEPIQRVLLSTLAVDTPEACRKVVEYYARALAHRGLAPHPEIRLQGWRNSPTAPRTHRPRPAINLVIAWRILLMTLLGREHPDLPPDVMFSELEIKIVNAFAAQQGLEAPDTLAKAIHTVARIGGYIQRARAPPSEQGSCGGSAPPSPECASVFTLAMEQKAWKKTGLLSSIRAT